MEKIDVEKIKKDIFNKFIIYLENNLSWDNPREIFLSFLESQNLKEFEYLWDEIKDIKIPDITLYEHLLYLSKIKWNKEVIKKIALYVIDKYIKIFPNKLELKNLRLIVEKEVFTKKNDLEWYLNELKSFLEVNLTKIISSLSKDEIKKLDQIDIDISEIKDLLWWSLSEEDIKSILSMFVISYSLQTDFYKEFKNNFSKIFNINLIFDIKDYFEYCQKTNQDFNDINVLKDYLNLNNNIWINEIILKYINWDNLTLDEKKKLFYEAYWWLDNIKQKIFFNLWLNYYYNFDKKILDEIINFSSYNFNINWIDIWVDFILPNISKVEDFFNFKPSIIYKVTYNDSLKNLFDKYSFEIKWYKITPFEKVNIKVKNKTSEIEYKDVNVIKENWKILILENDKSIYIDESEILNIIPVGKKILEFDISSYMFYDFITNLWLINKISNIFKLKDEEDQKDKQKQQIEYTNIINELKLFNWEKVNISDIKELEKYNFIVKWDRIKLDGFSNEIYSIKIKITDWKIYFYWIDHFWNKTDDYEVSLDNLLDIFRNLRLKYNAYIFKDINNFNEFSTYITNININKGSLWSFRNLEYKNYWIYKWEEVKYIVKRYYKGWQEEFNTFEIKFDNTSADIYVCIKYTKKWCKKKQLLIKNIPYNNLLWWILNETNLDPMTDQEYNDFISYKFFNIKDKNFNINFYSIASILATIKVLKDWFKWYFKEIKERKELEAYFRILDKLPSIWFLWDLKIEAEAEWQWKMLAIIQKYKNKLLKTDEWKAWAHAEAAAKIIENEIFKKIITKDLDRRKKYKAAWYLLYALEKWWSPYFRSLWKYNWQWMWVKALLWSSHHKKWELEQKDLIFQLKKSDDINIRNKLVMSELLYIVKNWDKIFPKNFLSSLEPMIYSLYDVWKAKSVKEDELKKWNYYAIEEAFNWYMKARVGVRVLWAYEWLVSLTFSWEDYNNTYKNTILLLLSWYPYTEFNSDMLFRFITICRTFWFQIWLYSINQDWYKDLLKLLDYIVEQKWINLWWKTFTEYIYWTKVENLNIWDYKYRSSEFVQSLTKKFNDFWQDYWYTIVQVLDFTDPLLIKEKNLENKKIISKYISFVNENYTHSYWIDKELIIPNWTQYFEWAFNMNRWLFRYLVLNIDEWWFKDPWVAITIINWILWKLMRFKDYIDDEWVVEFLLRKFDIWFWLYYSFEWPVKDNIRNAFLNIKNLKKEEFVDKIVGIYKTIFSFEWNYPYELIYLIKEYSSLLYDWLVTKDNHKEIIFKSLNI